jgi:hypothetical protein
MKKSHLHFLLCILFIYSVQAETPDWVRNNGRSKEISNSEFLTGFGMAVITHDITKSECLQLALDNAKKSLIEQIYVKVHSTASSKTAESEDHTASYFSVATQSTSSLELLGLQTKIYYDDDESIYYALAIVERKRQYDFYSANAVQAKKEIARLLDLGRMNEERGEKTKALENYLACIQLFHEKEQAQMIAVVLQSNIEKAFSELEGSGKQEEDQLDAIHASIERLLQKPIKTVGDLAWFIAYSLKVQKPDTTFTLAVLPLTYQDTRMSSPFAIYLQQILSGKVVEVCRWNVLAQSKAMPHDRVLLGVYYKQALGMKFIATLRGVGDGKLIATSEAFLDSEAVAQTGLSIVPENYVQAARDQKTFADGEVATEGLQLDVWTNKGSDNLVFAKRERMRVLLKVNLPSYIRFVYHLADGGRVLLMDNYYIDQTKVNHDYEIPTEFQCDAPFGAEVLQVFARTEPFPEVQTVKKGEYDIIVGDLSKFLSQTRGMTKVKQGLVQAERRVVITTVNE